MFFVYSNTTESSKCQISNCPYPMMKGRHSKTLEKHIEMRHPDSYGILLKEKENMNAGESSEDEISTPEKRLKVSKIILYFILPPTYCIILFVPIFSGCFITQSLILFHGLNKFNYIHIGTCII